ncbi:MAG: 50S ribosomal protein L4 [Nitrospirales bacterium]|nr:MAG: 50S ribosomal protein L4 [Nitrospirales bacterium]
MPTYKVTNADGSQAESLELGERVFGAPVDRSLLHAAVNMQRASFRQGTSSTKGRGEVAGSGKKPWKQKHTGRARSGSVRSPIWRHGGIVFGPQPRDYSYRMPRKMYRLALRSALSSRVNDGDVVILAGIALPEQKTRHLATVLSDAGVSGGALIVVGEHYLALERASRNLSGVKLTKIENLNVYDILRYEKIVLIQGEVEKIQEFWS